MKHTMRTLLGVLLALTMAVGLLPGMLSTAHADGYCPNCGSQDFFWSDWDDCFLCNNCSADFDEPSSTPPGGGGAPTSCPDCGSTDISWDSDADEWHCNECSYMWSAPGPSASHTHSFTYNANGASITATCTGDGNCDYKTNGITLTINAPSSLVCDGSAKAATISGSVPEGLGLATPSGITYNPGGSTAPSTPGTYTASFSWGGTETASV